MILHQLKTFNIYGENNLQMFKLKTRMGKTWDLKMLSKCSRNSEILTFHLEKSTGMPPELDFPLGKWEKLSEFRGTITPNYIQLTDVSWM